MMNQFRNARENQRLGIGRTLQYNHITAETFREALTDVIENPKYRERAGRLFHAVRDEKESPLERAVWWLEYVARTGDAPHLRLRSPALALHWSQVYQLDVLAALLAAPLALLYLFCLTSSRFVHLARSLRSLTSHWSHDKTD